MKYFPTSFYSGSGPTQPEKPESSSQPQSSVNGGQNGSSQAGLNGGEKDRNDNKIQQQQQPTVPSGNNTKCLEDPNFSFDEPKASKSVDTAKPSVETPPAKNKKPSYRVLEDPDLEIPHPAPAGGFKSDPMTTSIYQPKQ